MNTLILNQSQAEAVYGAMCALNNVGGLLQAALEEDRAIHVAELASGGVQVWRAYVHGQDQASEVYADQAAFATAYGLQ